MDTSRFRSARITRRENLQDVIPISTPYQLVIDTTNACNFKCAFCPTSDRELLKSVNRPIGTMPFDLFCKIIDDCKQFDSRIRRIDFGKDGEPLLNKRFPDMVRYIKDAGIADMVGVATNAALLTHEMADALVDAGLDLLKVSVEAVSSSGYEKIAAVKFDYDQLLERVSYLFEHRQQCKVYAKIIDYGLPQADKDKFFDDFDSISDYITIDTVSGWSVVSAKDFTLGTKPDSYLDLPAFNQKEVCPFPFYTLSINFDGSVSICCVDWSLSTLVGDLRTESLKDLWNGERLYEFRRMHLTGNRHMNKACGDCHTRNGLPDNIDAYAGEILEKLTAQRAAL
jgi:MoaA/NifB/PqqE/SkfB family radical SAM enzyme